jgi:hypothetical protein
MLAAAVFCAALSACDLETPTLASATVSLYQAGQPLRSWQLTPTQVASLDAWLTQHRAGWSPDFATYVPRVLISAKRTDGSSWGIYVLGTVVVIVGASTQLKQSFERIEIDSLVAVIGAVT